MDYKQKFSAAFQIINEIEKAGGEAYIVGGAVRDYIACRPITDVDIATSLTPSLIQEIFDKVIPIGIAHGTVMVRFHGESYEITTYRTEEGYNDYRHPDEVTFVRDIKQDLARRDFTMNAMAMDRSGGIVDPYGGRKDIEQKYISAVGIPHDRFQEDPLRMMRALRFVSQMNFEINHSTKEAVLRNAHLLEHIAIERIAVETIKLYAGKGFQKGLLLMEEMGVKKHLPIIQEILEIKKQIPKAQLRTWPEVIAFYLYRGYGSDVRNWIKKWKLSNKAKLDAECLYASLTSFAINGSISSWLVYQLPEQLFEPFSRVLDAVEGTNKNWLQHLSFQQNLLPIKTTSQLKFQAEDLLQMFNSLPKGPWISAKVLEIEKQVIKGNLPNEYEKIKEWVEWNPPANN